MESKRNGDETQKIFTKQVSQPGLIIDVEKSTIHVFFIDANLFENQASSTCFRAACLARLYFAIWGKSIPVLLGVIENFGLTYELFSEIPSCECSVDEGDLGSEGSRFRGTSRHQHQKSEAENITIITTVRPLKGKQRNYSDSNILRARKARKVPIEVELSRKHQLNCITKALSIVEKHETQRLKKRISCLKDQLQNMKRSIVRKDEIIKELLRERNAYITVSKSNSCLLPLQLFSSRNSFVQKLKQRLE
uniref:Uncharacterized protein n=1 Tax=Glossina austeni TaxID=7395 RepID=A0A1A9VL90_GLOAU